ncbi:MAG: O-antigen ligase family protein [Myxococcales bacterium]|nr:O-antigen ligase family protein [Myxococcales bacterium]
MSTPASPLPTVAPLSAASVWPDRLAWFSLVVFAAALPLNLVTVQFALGLVAVSIVWRALLRGAWPLSRTALDWPFAAYLTAIGVSWIASPYGITSYWAATSFWVLIAYYVVRFGVPDRRVVRAIAIAFLIGSAIAALYGVVQHFTKFYLYLPGAHPHIRQPVSGTKFVALGAFHRHTTFAFVAMFSVTLSVSLLLERGHSWWLRALYLGCAALGTFSIFYSHARAVWFALGAALFVVGASHGRRALVLIIIAGLFGTAGAAASSEAVRGKFRTLFEWNYKSNQDRAFAWRHTLRMVRDYPLTGIGYGNFTAVTHDYFDQERPNFAFRCHAHNNYLHLLAEIGPLGLAAFLWIWVVLLRSGWRAYRRLPTNEGDFGRPFVRAALGSYVGVLVGSTTQDPFFIGSIVFTLWLFAGIVHVLEADASVAQS